MNNKNRKIALFLPSLDIGGVERVTLNLAKGFVECGLSVDLVLVEARGAYLQRIPQGIHIVNLKAKRVLKSLYPLANYLRAAKPVGFISAKEYANIIALIANSMTRVPTRMLISIHTTLSKHFQYSKSFKERIMVPFLARQLYSRADCIVAVSKGVADDTAKFLSLPRDRITVIYNPVLMDDIFKTAQHPVDHPWFNQGGCPIILSIGRLTIAKDYPTLIKAFAKVKRQRDARLVIIGEGEERKVIEDLVRRLGLEKFVWLPGFLNPPYPYLARASLFVLSSIWEGLPTAIIEALALGIPVVSTDCPGSPREILENGRFGELVPVGNVQALADAILRNLDVRHKHNWLNERGNQFSVGIAVAQYIDLLGITESIITTLQKK